MVASPAVVAQDRCLYGVEEGDVSVFAEGNGVEIDVAQAPEAIASPRVERAVVACLFDCIEDVAKLDDVAAPGAIADIDACPRHIVD